VTGGSHPTVVNDDVATTYLLGPGKDLASYGSYARQWMTGPTLAAGERCVQYRARVKAHVNDSGGTSRKTAFYLQLRLQGSLSNPSHPANYWTNVPTGPTPKEYAGTWRTRSPDGKELTQTKLASQVIQAIDRTPTSFASGQRIRLSEVYLDYIVNRQPTLTSLTASDTTTSTSPLIGYTWNDLDGDTQIKNHVKVYTVAQATTPGFSPDKTIPIYDSGVTSTSLPEHRTQTNLVPGVAYRAYVRAAQSLGDLGDWWTVWSFVAFTIVLTAPPSPTLEDLGYESLFDRVLLRLRGRINDLLDQDSSFEQAGVGNWAADTNCTILNSTEWAKVGIHSLQLSSTAAGTMQASTLLFSASEGRTYWARGTSRAATVARQCRVGLGFFNAAGALIGSRVWSAAANNATGADTDYTLINAVAPAGTRFRDIAVEVQSTAAGAELHRFDAMATGPGAGAAPAYHVGDLTQPGFTGYEMQYADMVREGNIVHQNISSGGGFFLDVDGWFPRNSTDVIEVSNEVPAYRGDHVIRWVPMTTGSVLDVGSRLNTVDPFAWAVKPGQIYTHSVRIRPYINTYTLIVRFVYMDALGATISSVQTTLAAGTSWTLFAPGDSTAPAGSVVSRMEVENSSGQTEIPVFLDDVQFGEVGHDMNQGDPGQGSLLTWQNWRGSTDPVLEDFSALIVAQDLVAAQEASLYEHEVPPNKLRLFRVRAISIIAGLDVASDWSAILPISTNLTANWLKYPWEPSLNFQPMINGLRPMGRKRSLRKGIHNIVGRKTPAIISSIPSSESFEVEFAVSTLSGWHKLDEMLQSNGPLLLKTPKQQWWFHPIGDPTLDDWTVREDGQGFWKSVTVECLESATP
jgi:hypothetical protein